MGRITKKGKAEVVSFSVIKVSLSQGMRKWNRTVIKGGLCTLLGEEVGK